MSPGLLPMAHCWRDGRYAAAVLALLAAVPIAPARPPEPAVKLGSDRFRQTSSVAAIAYSADGKRLATIDGYAIHIWDASDGRCLQTVHFRNHEVLAVAFEAESGNLIAAAHFDRVTWICRVDPADKKLPSRRAVVTERAICQFSPDGKYLAFRKLDETLAQVVDTSIERAVLSDWRNKDKFRSFGFRSDGKVVAVSTQGGLVRVHDLQTGKALHEFRVEGGAAAGMTFSPDGKDLVAEIAATVWTQLACFDAATGKVRWRHFAHLAQQPAFTCDGTAVRYYGVPAFSNDYLAWRWLDATTGKLLNGTMFADDGEPATRPDGKVLAIGGRDGLISQWDLKSRQRLDDASADPPAQVTKVRFTPDGKNVRGWVRGWYEWDIKSGKQTRLTPKTDDSSTRPIAVSHNQEWLAKLVPDREREHFEVEIENLRSGKCTRPLSAGRFPYWLDFTPTGRLVVFEKNGLTLLDPGSEKQPARVNWGRTRMTSPSRTRGRPPWKSSGRRGGFGSSTGT